MATPVNVLEPIEAEFDPFAAASDPAVITPNYDLYGMVEISAYACHLQKGVGKVPFDPTNPDHKRMTAIQVFIQPLPEIEVKYPKTLEMDWIGEFPTWAKITLPSIKAAGFENVREINGKYARVTRVDSLDKPYDKKDKDGNPTGEKGVKKTFKFVEFYDTEDACRAANAEKSAGAWMAYLATATFIASAPGRAARRSAHGRPRRGRSRSTPTAWSCRAGACIRACPRTPRCRRRRSSREDSR